MARAPSVDVAGYCYHVLNRANARYRMFTKDGDFEAFERVLEQAVAPGDNFKCVEDARSPELGLGP